MDRRERLTRCDVHGLRRLLRCVRIGLAMPPDTVHLAGDREEGPGSDEQLTGKVEQVMEDEIDDVDGPEPGTADLPAECCYPGCILTGKGRDGMCVKHIIALGRGDPEAIEAARQYHAVHDRHEEPEKFRWCGTRDKQREQVMPPAAPPAREQLHAKQETTMKATNKVPCKKCGREFLANGIGKHRASCKGPGGGKNGPACPVCGKIAKNPRGLRCHLGRTECGDSADVRHIRKAMAKDRGQLTMDNGARRVPHPQLSTVDRPLPHAFTRMAELLGLAGQIVDCPHPEGRCFVNSANGKAAIVAPDGSIRAAEVIAR